MKSLITILLGLYGSWHFTDIASDSSLQRILATVVVAIESADAELTHAGDTVYVDENSSGSWEVLGTVRQACLTFKRD